MASPIKLISTDFDGTLFSEFENPPVPPELQSLLRRFQEDGARWIVNTGRDISSLMETLGRAHLSVQPDGLVVVEREIYLRHGGQFVEHQPWNKACSDAHAELFRQVRPDLPELVSWINQRFSATLYEDSWSPLCITAGSNDDCDAILERLDQYCLGVPDLTVVRNDVYARFSHVAYNKGSALSEIIRILDLTPEQTVAAGDHWNDLPMLTKERARHLIAPMNAIDEIKSLVRSQGGWVSERPCGWGVLDGLERLRGNRIGDETTC